MFRLIIIDTRERKWVVSVVNESSVVNIAQLTGTEDGKVLDPTYASLSFFAKHCTIMCNNKFHHLCFDSAMPSCVFVKERSGSPEEEDLEEG